MYMYLSSIGFVPLLVLKFAVLWRTSNGNTPYMRCEASRATLEYVDRCPKDETEWKKAASEKGCSAVRQNCTSSHNFVYHCLINAWENATVDVCATRVLIIGKCAEYNAKGAVVQQHERLDCKMFTHPCPEFYWSDKAYLYQECYTTVRKTTKITTNTASRMHGFGAANGIACIVSIVHLTIFLIYNAK